MNTLISKTLNAQFSLKRNLGNANIKVLSKLFDSLVKPISTYGSEIWAADVINWENRDFENIIFEGKYKFDILHARFCKQVLQVSRNCTNILALAEIGRYPVIIDVCSAIINFWAHARQSPTNSLVYICSNIEENSTLFNYSSIVKIILGSEVDFSCLDEDKTKNILKSVKNNLRKKYELNFFKSINRPSAAPSKCREYNKVKKNYKCENYLTSSTPNKSYISKIRTSCHYFPIEIGRWHNIDKNKRYCFICNNKNSIGDEKHVLFECYNPDLIDIRNKYISLIGDINDQLMMFDTESLYIYTLLSHDNAVIKYIGTFFKKVYNFTKEFKTKLPNNALKKWISECQR